MAVGPGWSSRFLAVRCIIAASRGITSPATTTIRVIAVAALVLLLLSGCAKDPNASDGFAQQIDLPVAYSLDVPQFTADDTERLILYADGTVKLRDITVGRIDVANGKTCVRASGPPVSGSGTWTRDKPGWLGIEVAQGQVAIGAHSARFDELDWTLVGIRSCKTGALTWYSQE